MLKSNLKFIIIAVIIFITVIIVVVIVSPKKSTSTSTNSSISPTLTVPTTNYALGTTPSVVPIPDFTGADSVQTLPPEMQSVGEQKTSLRRLTPFSLDFAVVEFDYENDIFLVQLFDPVEESRPQFASWRAQSYPALKDIQFSIN